MSDIFDLDIEGQTSQAALARTNGIPIDQVSRGFLSDVPKAIGMGIERGGARAAQAVGLAGGGLLSLVEDQPGALTDPYFRTLDKYVGDAVDYWTPGANEVGTAGRILGGFAEMALPLMVSGGDPAFLIGTSELGGAQDLAKQGASNTGAIAGGVIQGLSTAAGFKIPFLGKTLASRLVSGAAGNLAVNAGATVAEREVLKLTGDTQQAQQFDPLDLEARAVDVLSGLAFGGLAHLAAPSVRDAAATAANAKHFQEDTAPGRPADIAASVSHQSAMEAAIRDTLEGKPVDLSRTGVQDADFIARPRPLGHLEDIPEELKGVDEAIKEQPAQNPEQVDLPKEAPIVQFRREASAIESTLPDVQEGMTRLWRGNRPDEVGQNPQFTNDLPGIALPFRKGYGGEVSYVDIPSDRLGEFVNKGAAAKDAEFTLPKELAAKAALATKGGKAIVPDSATQAVDPIVSSAHAALAQKDFPIPTGEMDTEGRMVTRSAREMLAEADQGVAKAQNDAKAFDALVGCILFRGN